MYLRLDPSNGIPLAVQIGSGLRMAIAGQRLRPGEQLPSARDLAAELHVNFHTVRKAYGDLEADGLLETRRGLGTFVAASRQSRSARLRQIVRPHVEALVRDLAGSDFDGDEVADLVGAELARLAVTRTRR